MTEAVPFPEKTILLSYDPAVFRRGEKKDAMFLNVSLGRGGFDLGLDLLGGHNAAVGHGDGCNGIGHHYRFLSFMVLSISRAASRLAEASRLS